MAVNQTNVTIVGRLVSDPDYRQTLSDTDVTHFRMASNERRYDKQSEQWVNGDVLYVDVTCWRRLAFNVHACLAKGDPVVVTGRLYTEEYEIDGKRRSNIKVEATSIGPDLAWITAVARRRKDRPDAEQAEQPGQNGSVLVEQPVEPVDGLVDGLVGEHSQPREAVMAMA